MVVFRELSFFSSAGLPSVFEAERQTVKLSPWRECINRAQATSVTSIVTVTNVTSVDTVTTVTSVAGVSSVATVTSVAGVTSVTSTWRLSGCVGGSCASRCSCAHCGFTGCCGSGSIFGGGGGACLIRGGSAGLWHRGALLCGGLRNTSNTM